MEAIGIVTRSDEQRTGDVGADAFDGEQLRRGGADELLQVHIQGVDLGAELPIADGQPLQGQLGGRQWSDERGPRSHGAEGRHDPDQLGHGQGAQPGTQFIGGGNDQGMQLIGGLGAGLHRGAASQPQGSDHFDATIAGLRLADRPCRPALPARRLRHRADRTCHVVAGPVDRGDGGARLR